MTRITFKMLDKQTALKIVETTYALLHEHGLYDWKVRFSTATTRFGSCSYRTRTIRLSEVFAAQRSWKETYDTILHEVAHAIAGPYAKHGPEWKRVARELGLSNPTAATRSEVKIEQAWKGVCSNGHEHFMSRAPQRVRSCSHCHRGFSFQHVIEWTHHGKVVTMPVKYQREYNYLQERERQRERLQNIRITA